jgi:hypothetical protein
MPDSVILMTAAAAALAWILLGGGLYEFLAIDPSWPKRPELIQPARGGISRKRFWIPVHTAFELTLIAALVMTWGLPDIRFWLLVALASHGAMRVWSALDFIPKALAFERANPAEVSPAAARRWSRRSMLRLPLDLTTCFSALVAFAAALRSL